MNISSKIVNEITYQYDESGNLTAAIIGGVNILPIVDSDTRERLQYEASIELMAYHSETGTY